jgi:hypothetical protein
LVPGFLVIAIVGLMSWGLCALLIRPEVWFPFRGIWAVRGLAALFVAADIGLAIGLLALLLTRDRWPPKWLDGILPLRGRWLWMALLVFLIVGYLAMSPVFLWLLVRVQAP